nr:MAG TPA: hypothetical protein [Caudoviricetes sp.]
MRLKLYIKQKKLLPKVVGVLYIVSQMRAKKLDGIYTRVGVRSNLILDILPNNLVQEF